MDGGMAAAATAAAALGNSSISTPPDELVGTIKGIGVTGSLLYTGMLLFVGWRTRAFFRAGGDGNAAAGAFPAKAFFHLFLLSSCLSDLPYYYKLGGGTVSKASYSLHLIAILLDLCAFSMLCVAWSRPLQISRDHDQDRVLTTVLALDCFVLVYSLVVIALIIISSTDVDHFVASSPQPYLFFFLVHGLALLVFCCWLLAFGVRLQRAIRAHPRWEPVRRERRLRITMRINGVLLLCGSCFLLRVALLLVHFIQAETGDERAILEPRAVVSWYIFATWIPFLVPACTLLLMMRPGTTTATFGAAGNGGQTAATVGLTSSPLHKKQNGEGKDTWGLDEPLVSPAADTQPLAARAFLARLQEGNLYMSPPVAAAAGGGVGGGHGSGGSGRAVLDLGDWDGKGRSRGGGGGGEEEEVEEVEEEEEEEEGEDNMAGVDAERKDERTTSSLSSAGGGIKRDDATVPLKRMDVEDV